MDPAPSTGLPSLDAVLRGLRAGDNVVWQVEAVDDYPAVARPFAERALREGRRLVYFRFARHAPVVPDGAAATVHRLDPASGFEPFTAAIHRAIAAAGAGAFHVFDCLSDLAADWSSDLMLGNFFRVTCPYLYELDTVAYFALQRDGHSPEAVDAIRRTTQVLIDVFRHHQVLHVHPLKVEGRHSPTMYLPHAQGPDGTFGPLTASSDVSEALADVSERRLDPVARLDAWDRRFVEARALRDAAVSGARPQGEADAAFRGLLRTVLTRDERFARLAERHLDLEDLFAIRRRMIGTGLVGGKAAGMLVARAVLAREHPDLARRLEPHDAWFVGSDVFYTYLVRNGLWRERFERRAGVTPAGGAEVRERLLAGTFPEAALQAMQAMLDFYGQSPIIVRSSSLLEDGYGNAFTGKYESVFCPNQGDPEERLEAFLAAVRTVYASTVSEEALRYRERRGLLDRDEQMAVLVQRVSGAVHGRWFYPQAAGVALSYNPYVWDHRIDPQAGVVRLVFGLGTRAVERADDDYTRIVALNEPRLRPEHGVDAETEYAQRRADVLDLEDRRFVSLAADRVIAGSPDLPVNLFATARPGGRWVLTFEELLWSTTLVDDLRTLLAALREAYEVPVDVEFTCNARPDGLRLNLVQCRPLQVREGGAVVPPPAGLAPEEVLLRSRGPIVGPSAHGPVDRVIYVDPDAYARLGTGDRHEVGRVVGRITRLDAARAPRILLLGPGRWGTTTPSLGVPVSFAEIQRVSALCEIMRLGDVIPDVSLGSHFFNDLVEEAMLYLALYPGYPGHALDEARLRAAPNLLPELLPDDARLATVVHVVDFPGEGEPRALWLAADCVRQEVTAWVQAQPGGGGAGVGEP